MALSKSLIAALITIAATGVILTLATSALLSANQNVPVQGTVSAVNVGVYTDSACTTNCTSISAGTLAPGTSKTFTVYVKNTGTVPMTLSMTDSGWNPSAADGPITLTWNRDAYSLAAGASVTATLTLTVSSSISSSITSFSFNVAITGTG
jgi:hypothetical protein